MSIQILQRAAWAGHPVKQGDFIRLRKQKKDGRELEPIAELWTHASGGSCS
jgi:hypothetical protein